MDQINSKPSIAEQLEWALKKLGEGDFGFEPAGVNGRRELTVYDFGLESADEDRKLEKAIPSIIKGLDEEVVSALAGGPLQSVFGRYLIQARKSLVSRGDVSAEQTFLATASDTVKDCIALACVAEFAGRFPRIVSRFERLRMLGANATFPVDVQRYLDEATRCFVSGEFIACLLICRSAIEFALRYRLEREGKQQVLSQLDAKGQATLDGLISAARMELSWELGKTLDAADQVKKKANIAIHRQSPDVETCQSMFEITRGVLRELFA